MENLKVNDWVNYQGKKRQIAIVNEDGTVRLKSDDPTEKYYDNGTIGCFSQSMFVDKQKTAVEYLLEQMGLEQLIFPKDIINKALEMEKQQIIDAYLDGYSAPENLGDSEQYYNQTYKSK
jgi:ribosome assembly protein YihI (activator of Der GTPase)